MTDKNNSSTTNNKKNIKRRADRQKNNIYEHKEKEKSNTDDFVYIFKHWRQKYIMRIFYSLTITCILKLHQLTEA